VGAILAELERLGPAENTIVVYTSDHGDMMGSKLLAKTVMYEESVKVPWLMRIPQMNRRRAILPGRYSHIDLVPTLLELMGNKNADLPGRSLAPVIKGERRAQREVFVQWNRSEGQLSASLSNVTREEVARVQDAPIRTVITQDGWKLCRCDRDKHQLFDLNSDPYETRNLYYTGDHAKRIGDLTKRIRDWQTDVKDSATA